MSLVRTKSIIQNFDYEDLESYYLGLNEENRKNILKKLSELNVNEKEENEILTNKNEFRYTLFPIKYKDIWDFHKKAESCFWKAQEIDFSKDKVHFNKKLNEDERYFIKQILAFFASSDTIVNMNIEANYLDKITLTEAKVAYEFQAAMENIHSETYSLMIDNLIDDTKEKNLLYNAVIEFPSIKKKKDWAEKWINDGNYYSLGQILIAFAIVEGVFFSGAFCAIYWIKHKPTKDKENLMPGLTSSNEFIARDEGMHTQFACLLYNNYIKNKVDKDIVKEMFMEAIEIETNFITKSLPCRLIGMNSDKMIDYIKYVGDRLLVELGYDKIYNINECPFEFMEAISLEGKTNFFENRPSEYQKAVNNISSGDLDLDDDF